MSGLFVDWTCFEINFLEMQDGSIIHVRPFKTKWSDNTTTQACTTFILGWRFSVAVTRWTRST